MSLFDDMRIFDPKVKTDKVQLRTGEITHHFTVKRQEFEHKIKAGKNTYRITFQTFLN